MSGEQGREYQFITGGDDGMVFWWNCNAPIINDLRAIEPADWRQPNKMLTLASSCQIETIQPIHDIHLTENAYIYSIVIGRNSACFGDSQGILTFYNTTYKGLEDDVTEDIDPLIDQVNDEGVKEIPNSKDTNTSIKSNGSKSTKGHSAAAASSYSSSKKDRRRDEEEERKGTDPQDINDDPHSSGVQYNNPYAR